MYKYLSLLPAVFVSFPSTILYPIIERLGGVIGAFVTPHSRVAGSLWFNHPDCLLLWPSPWSPYHLITSLRSLEVGVRGGRVNILVPSFTAPIPPHPHPFYGPAPFVTCATFPRGRRELVVGKINIAVDMVWTAVELRRSCLSVSPIYVPPWHSYSLEDFGVQTYSWSFRSNAGGVDQLI